MKLKLIFLVFRILIAAAIPVTTAMADGTGDGIEQRDDSQGDRT